ncbi:MAG: DUF4367 domain-containing protein [Clostridia bacterium]|nr:DUF4367 domain-containing protein [Clostridia bacterium]
MSNNNERLDKILDILIDEAVESALDKELTEYESAEQHVFSKEHEEKMQKIFNKHKRKLFFQKACKFATRAACFALAFLITSSIVVFSVTAWRIKFLNFMLDLSQPNSRFNYTDNVANSYKDENIEMQYIPYGFILEDKFIKDYKMRWKFNYGDEYILLSCSNIKGDFTADTENSMTENITIDDKEAIYISKDRRNIIFWNVDNVYYMLVGSINKDELVKIAEGIK